MVSVCFFFFDIPQPGCMITFVHGIMYLPILHETYPYYVYLMILVMPYTHTSHIYSSLITFIGKHLEIFSAILHPGCNPITARSHDLHSTVVVPFVNKDK